MNELQKLIFDGKFSDAYNLVESLPKNDPMINPKNGFLNPLIYSAKLNKYPLISALIKKGADINVKSKAENRTPLLESIINRQEYTTALLLKNKADPNIYDNHKNIPLIIALERNRVKLVSQILQNKANLDVIDRRGYSPLAIACSKGLYEIAELLLEKGATPNIKDHNGQSPIYFAKDLNIVELLINKGADLYKKDKFGNTPLDFFIKGSPIHSTIKKELYSREWKREQEITIKDIAKIKRIPRKKIQFKNTPVKRVNRHE